MTPDTDARRTVDAALMAHLQQWQGRCDILNDTITAAPLRGWSAALDRDDPAPVAGDPVPPLAHWLYFLPPHPQRELGPDGHALRGGFLPPVPLPRRMWAGGRMRWHAPLRVGDAAERHSRIASVSHKAGRGGDLVFVQVHHEVHGPSGLCLAEEHDIVYRAAAQPGERSAATPAAVRESPWRRILVPDEVLLFRYSALTFNGHRIHYDRRYATEVEGYPGLVVHGPLIATLLMDLLRRQQAQARPAAFRFRALRPSFDGQALHLCGQPQGGGHKVSLWAQDGQGNIAMEASATLA